MVGNGDRLRRDRHLRGASAHETRRLLLFPERDPPCGRAVPGQSRFPYPWAHRWRNGGAHDAPPSIGTQAGIQSWTVLPIRGSAANTDLPISLGDARHDQRLGLGGRVLRGAKHQLVLGHGHQPGRPHQQKYALGRTCLAGSRRRFGRRARQCESGASGGPDLLVRRLLFVAAPGGGRRPVRGLSRLHLPEPDVYAPGDSVRLHEGGELVAQEDIGAGDYPRRDSGAHEGGDRGGDYRPNGRGGPADTDDPGPRETPGDEGSG